jgi:agmatinase
MEESLPPENFGGLPDELSRRSSSAVLVLPIPYEQTTSYGGGTRNGPRAILHASRFVEFYDSHVDGEPFLRGVHTLSAVAQHGGGPVAMRERIAGAVGSAMAEGKLLVALGGEHSITPGVVDGVARHVKDFTVVQFDAHADLRDEYEGSRMSHACAMRRVLETHPVVSIGIRAVSTEEVEFARAQRVPTIPAERVAAPGADLAAVEREMLAAIRTERVFVTFDVDALDPSIMPSTGTPEPGGLDWYTTLRLLRALAREREIVAFDVVELAPIPGLHAPDFLTAKLTYMLMGAILERRPA